jgi:glycosyltransferase involved in cell wall biosynthesis
MTAAPHILLVSDRIAARNGRALWNERFVTSCDALGVRVSVVGDAAEMPGAPGARVTPLRSLAHPDHPWEQERGLGVRPFITTRPEHPGLQGERERLAIERLRRAFAEGEERGGEKFDGLDGFEAASRMLGAMADELDALVERLRPSALLVSTQSFLGMAAAAVAARRPGLTTRFFLHSDYAAIFFERLLGAAGLTAHRAELRPYQDALYARFARLLPEGALCLARAPQLPYRLALSSLIERPPRAELLPPAVFRDADAPRAEERRAPGDGEPWEAVVVGRLDYDKNVGFLPRSARHVRGFRWVVIGEGPLRASLQQAWPDAVFTGQLPRHEVLGHMARAQLVVSASRVDTFGESLFEALSVGTPVLASNENGPTSFVIEGDTGFLRPLEEDVFCRPLEELRRSRGAPRGWRPSTRGAR